MKRYLLLAMLPFIVCSCTKGNDEDPGVAGKGGNGTLRVLPKHHGKQIDSCTVFIKYNSADPPVSHLYDDSLHCQRINDTLVATFTGLKNGPYYLFGYGWDARNLTPGDTVQGAFAYQLQDAGTHTVELAVSED